MTFGQAYPRLLEGRGIRRKAWDQGVVVRLSQDGPDYLVMHHIEGCTSRFNLRPLDLYDKQLQLLREDWEIVL